jgi:AraC family transcriptional regulator
MGSLLTRTIYRGRPSAPPGLGGFHVRALDTSGLHFTETSHPPGYKLPVHSHRMVSFYLVLSGGVTEQFGRERSERTPGALVFTPAGEEHSDVIHSSGARCLIVELQPRTVERALECGSLPKAPASFGGRAAHLAKRLYTEFRFSDSLSPLILEGLALEMLAEVCHTGPRRRDACPKSRIDHAREFLDTHYAEPVSLARIADVVSLHPVYLARMFRQYHECSVGEYLRRRRIESACAQLSAGGKSLAEIASECGFCDQAHFTRTFHRLTGLTPAAYRGQRRN